MLRVVNKTKVFEMQKNCNVCVDFAFLYASIWRNVIGTATYQCHFEGQSEIHLTNLIPSKLALSDA